MQSFQFRLIYIHPFTQKSRDMYVHLCSIDLTSVFSVLSLVDSIAAHRIAADNKP